VIFPPNIVQLATGDHDAKKKLPAKRAFLAVSLAAAPGLVKKLL